jgi:hypothetical protein
VPGGRGQRVRAIFDASILATTETRNKIDENNLELSIYTWWRSGAKRETARALVERFGVKAFFTPVEAVLSQVWMWPIANSCLNSLLSKRTINDFTDFQRECIEISNLILVNHERIKHLELPTEAPDFLGISPGEPLKDWPSNPKLAEAIVVLFVSCALSCPEFEAEPNEIGLAELAIIFSVMRSKGELLSATEVLGTLPLSKKTQDIVIQWIVSARTKPRGTQAHDEDATNGTPAGPA